MPGPESATIDPMQNPNFISQVPPELQAATPLPTRKASPITDHVPGEADPMGDRAVSLDQLRTIRAGLEAVPDATPDTNQTVTPGGEFSNLLDPNGTNGSVEAAAVRPEATITTTQTEAERQAAIAAADRANRQAAGLEPRPLDI